jgi:hypothetical protein
MPHFWQIDPTQWINPEHIVYVEDKPDARRPDSRADPYLEIRMVAVVSGEQRLGDERYTIVLSGEDREKFLAYLARETESAPPPAPA